MRHTHPPESPEPQEPESLPVPVGAPLNSVGIPAPVVSPARILGRRLAVRPAPRPPRNQSLPASLDALLPAVRQAGDAGLTLSAIRTRFRVRPGARASEAQLQAKLSALVAEDAIWGPFRHCGSQYYFAVGRGPSVESASAALRRIVRGGGTRLISRTGLEERLTGKERRFFAAAIQHAVATRELIELGCGSSKYYLHREVVAAYFGFEAVRAQVQREGPPRMVTFEELLPVYERLRAEQSGFSAVRILDLMKALNLPKEVLHPFLIEEARSGRIAIHHITSVELPAEVLEAGIRLPGFAEPFVTVTFKHDR